MMGLDVNFTEVVRTQSNGMSNLKHGLNHINGKNQALGSPICLEWNLLLKKFHLLIQLKVTKYFLKMKCGWILCRSNYLYFKHVSFTEDDDNDKNETDVTNCDILML